MYIEIYRANKIYKTHNFRDFPRAFFSRSQNAPKKNTQGKCIKFMAFGITQKIPGKCFFEDQVS